jgi:hypothetical protein
MSRRYPKVGDKYREIGAEVSLYVVSIDRIRKEINFSYSEGGTAAVYCKFGDFPLYWEKVK